ncbi:MAG: hypothetical protein AAGI25_21140, partial [Bacteroidota bacterium]
QNEDKKLVAVALERKNKGIGRMYARVIKNGSSPSLRPFFHDHIDKNPKLKPMNGKDIVRLKPLTLISHRAHQVRKGSIFPRCIERS